jgi:diguanylate cyclase (GGDEF)-like protein
MAHTQFSYSRRLAVPFAMALVDLDHFKRINDSYGHDIGDHALRAFVAAAKGVLRAHDGLGRYGGEEWLMVLPGADTKALGEIFGRLRARFAETPIEGMPYPHRLTFSMGAVEASRDAVSVGSLIAEADRRLYRAKADGRDRLVATAPDSASAIRDHAAVVAHHAI